MLCLTKVETGGLLRLAVKLMVIMSPSPPEAHVHDYVKLVDLLGLHFQIRDDYCNLASTTYSINKVCAHFPRVYYVYT
jgi:geranylgeranyl diphosphate synthase type 3